MAVSSYGNSTDSSGVVRILKDLDASIEGRHVIVIEDIVDSGLTLSYLLRNLRGAQAGVARGVRAPDEAGPAQGGHRCRYVGFEIPNRFAIGYGLDYAERYREPAVRRRPRRVEAARARSTDADSPHGLQNRLAGADTGAGETPVVSFGPVSSSRRLAGRAVRIYPRGK